MPVPTIFLINTDGEIVEMSDQPYDSETRLQELLAKFPNLLAGDQMSSEAPVKWLLVEREGGIPDQVGGAARWSVDHVFIDQDGIPALVEVKRSGNPLLRREVVGQMLDYASNAVVNWPVETIRRRFEQTCIKANLEPASEVANLIGCTALADCDNIIVRFWEAVETNLRAGKIRLIFVADEIPEEVKRVVEFLNGQMNPAEVIAIEIRQYVGKGVTTLVPTVIRSNKRSNSPSDERKPINWEFESFLETLLERKGSEAVSIATAILDWAPTQDLKVSWGKGFRDGSCYVDLNHTGQRYSLFGIWTYGRISVNFGVLQRCLPTGSIAKLAAALTEIPGIHFSDESLNKYPAFDMSLVKTPEMRSRFLRAIAIAAGEIKAHPKDASAETSGRSTLNPE